jgi:ribosomal protein S18 acetylase RimI-like enzyme
VPPTPLPPPTRPTEFGPGAFAAALPELLDIYVTAMGYPNGTGRARSPLWLDHSHRPGFRCVVAVDASSPSGGDVARAAEAATPSASAGAATIAGFGYGYLGAAGQWWFDEVARGLGGPDNPWLADYFELTELHVRPTSQGRGTGEALLRALLAPVAARSVLLSTPEGVSRAWRLYRRLGFVDVLRDFRFTGDSRPFAVLGRALPLDDRNELERYVIPGIPA